MPFIKHWGWWHTLTVFFVSHLFSVVALHIFELTSGAAPAGTTPPVGDVFVSFGSAPNLAVRQITFALIASVVCAVGAWGGFRRIAELEDDAPKCEKEAAKRGYWPLSVLVAVSVAAGLIGGVPLVSAAFSNPSQALTTTVPRQELARMHNLPVEMFPEKLKATEVALSKELSLVKTPGTFRSDAGMFWTVEPTYPSGRLPSGGDDVVVIDGHELTAAS